MSETVVEYGIRYTSTIPDTPGSHITTYGSLVDAEKRLCHAAAGRDEQIVKRVVFVGDWQDVGMPVVGKKLRAGIEQGDGK